MMKKFLGLLLFLGIQQIFAIHSYQKSTACGILPYAFYKGDAYILFGKENRTWNAGANWAKKSATTWVWNDFGGSCDDVPSSGDNRLATEYNTTYNKVCAARECAEETGFVFGNQLPLPKVAKHQQIGHAIFKNSLQFLVNNITQRFSLTNYYVQYFAKVDYINEAILNQEAKKNAHEKKEFKWVKVDEVLNIKKAWWGSYHYLPTLGSNEIDKLFPYLVTTLQNSVVQNYLKQLQNQAQQEYGQEQQAKQTGVQIQALKQDFNQLIQTLTNLAAKL